MAEKPKQTVGHKRENKDISIDKMAIFCKKKGFVYPGSEIYGGFAGFWDYGQLGVELRNNIKQMWWKSFVQTRDDIIGIDGAIITNPRVWEASGHALHFIDVLVECKKCKHRLKAAMLIEDELNIKVDGLKPKEIDELIKKNRIVCPKCGAEFGASSEYNLMFKTSVGAADGIQAYLRPETAQSIFINFKSVEETSRKKLPFGIAQIGKAFRNEISPREFLFRLREFEQMEIEFFVHPDKIDDCPLLKEVAKLKVNVVTAEMQEKGKETKEMSIQEIVDKNLATPWHAYWLGLAYKWFVDFGIRKENLRIREHLQKELAHYAGACFDIEYKFPTGWKEIYGNADRKQYDLQQHMKFSGRDMTVFDEVTKKKVVPYVASEPSQGVDRTFLAFLFDAYTYDAKRDNVVLRLHPKLAPVKVAVLPLVSNKKEITKFARYVFDELKNEFVCAYDESGSIGRRYARNDEIGTPFCITIDFDSLNKNDVTIRDRNTTKQVRVKVKELCCAVSRLLSGEKIEDVGKLV